LSPRRQSHKTVALVQSVKESLYHPGVELASGAAGEFGYRPGEAEGLTVGTVGNHGVKTVRHGNDPRRQGNCLALPRSIGAEKGSLEGETP